MLSGLRHGSLGANFVSSLGKRISTGELACLGSESKTIGNKMTASNTRAMAPTRRLCLRRLQRLTSCASAMVARAAAIRLVYVITSPTVRKEPKTIILSFSVASSAPQRTPRRRAVLRDRGRYVLRQQNRRQFGRARAALPVECRQAPASHPRRECAHYARDILVAQHAEYRDRLGREAASARSCASPWAACGLCATSRITCGRPGRTWNRPGSATCARPWRTCCMPTGKRSRRLSSAHIAAAALRS